MRTFLVLTLVSFLMPATAVAQFTGPTTRGQTSTVAQARNARVDTYVTVTGNIVAHLREDYFTFRDSTGEIRVEIEPEVWQNREVGPDTVVRLLAEVDRNAAGTVYLWVQSLEIVN
jgi:uncharacterized protein (TIGR00156 family)